MPDMYNVNGLTPKTAEVFEAVSKLECLNELYLCGGTAEAIQLGHRQSEDLDFELLGLRKVRPALDFSGIINNIREVFPDARLEILGESQFHIFINSGCVKLSFFRPENPVKYIHIGLSYNNIRVPALQDLLGMKVFTICMRSLFRDYYDIYCLLENGCNLREAVDYASYLSRHNIRSKEMYSRLLAPQLYFKGDDFMKMSPRFDIEASDICARIEKAISDENIVLKK